MEYWFVNSKHFTLLNFADHAETGSKSFIIKSYFFTGHDKISFNNLK